MNPSTNEIINAVAYVFDVSRDEMLGRGMSRQVIYARFAMVRLLREIPAPGSGRKRSAGDIANHTGWGTGQKVNYATRRAAQEAATNTEFAVALVACKRMLGVQ